MNRVLPVARVKRCKLCSARSAKGSDLRGVAYELKIPGGWERRWTICEECISESAVTLLEQKMSLGVFRAADIVRASAGKRDDGARIP